MYGAIRPGYLNFIFLFFIIMRWEFMVCMDVIPISLICFIATAIRYITMLIYFYFSQP